MRVGLKYCGGCNPRYDRAAFARWLAAQHEDWEVTYAEREEAYDLLLVVSGCSAAASSAISPQNTSHSRSARSAPYACARSAFVGEIRW